MTTAYHASLAQPQRVYPRRRIVHACTVRRSRRSHRPNQITAITHSTDTNLSQGFAYDGLDRLTALASPPRDQGFSFDATGNLTTKFERIGTDPGATNTFTIQPTSNRLTQIANLAIGYGFDAAGNRTTTPTITHTYNARGRMSRSVVVNGATSQTFNYLINGLEQRVRKTGPSAVIPSGTQIFVYDDDGQLIGEYDNLGRARKEYVWLPDNQGNGPSWRPVAVVTYTYSGSSTTPASHAILAIEADHLGTPRRVSDTQNRTRWTWNPAPFGDSLPDENPSALGVFTLNLKFAGQYFDKETNLHYNHHRDYEAASGRYIQSDPIELRGGINTYVYVSGNPLAYSDPRGLDPWDCFSVSDCYGQAHANYKYCTNLYSPYIACALAIARCYVVAKSSKLLQLCLVSAAASCSAAQSVCLNQLFGELRFCDQRMSIDGYMVTDNFGEENCTCYSRPRYLQNKGM